MLSRPERRLLLAESTVEIAADCNVAGVASELAAVVDVIDDGFEPDLGIGSFPWARNREALGILYLEQRDASHALEMFGKALN